MTEIQIKNLIKEYEKGENGIMGLRGKNMKKNILSLWKLRNYHSIR